MNFFDLHTDTPTKIYGGMRNDDTAAYSKGVFEHYNAVKAIWIDDSEQNGKNYFEDVLRTYKSEKERCVSADITNLNEINKEILMVENASFLYNSSDYLYNMYKLGIRIISLSWNGQNPLAGGAKSNGELTADGAEIIKKTQEAGILIDISHLNMQSALKAVELIERPIATHSCCYEIVPNPRNITDNVLYEIKRKNGIIGLCLYPEFCGKNVFSGFEDNIRHLLKLGMEKNIAVGSDFDGAIMDEKLKTSADIPLLYGYLYNRGIKREILDDIFYNNAIEFFDGICQNI